MKIGVYIGSFNPVHIVHQEIVNDLISDKEVDLMYVIPTSDKYHLKSSLVKFDDRFNMLKLVFNSKNVIVSDLERTEYKYTYQNILSLKEIHRKDELYLIIGADNLFELKTWKNYVTILENCNLIVYGRNELYILGYINNNFTNYKNRFIIKEPIKEVSSTTIRNKIKSSESVHEFLDGKVIEYIEVNHLYRGD